MVTRLLLVAGFVLCWMPVVNAGQGAASAEQSNQSTPVTREVPASDEVVVVTASRREEQLINAPATMTVITEEAIANAPSQSLTDLMRLVPGVNITQMSARDVNLTIRAATGSLEDSALVLLDDRSMYLDFFGFVMWDFMPVDPAQIKQVEVIRGPASAVWGANALSGVVNVITKTPREMTGTSVSIQFGQFDRTRSGEDFDGGGHFAINASHAEAPTDRFAFKVSAGLFTQEPFLRPLGSVPGSQPPIPYPDFQNRGTTQPKLDARADYDFADRRQKLILAGGIAGTEGIIHTGLGPVDIQRGSTMKYGRITYHRNKLRLQAFVNALDGEGDLLLLQDVDGGRLDATFENQVYDVEFSNSHVLGTRHLLSYGGNFRHNAFDLSLAPRSNTRDEGGVYVQDDIFLTDHIRWIVGGRIDGFDVLHKAVFSPRLTLIVKPRPKHTFRVSFNQSFRAPSFFNSFADFRFLTPIDLGPAGDFLLPADTIGNLALEEEALTAYEASYVGAISPITLGAAFYVNDTRDMILFTQTNSYTSANPPPQWPLPPELADGLPSQYSYKNFPLVTDRGVELSLDARISPAVTAFVNYTWQDDPKTQDFPQSEVGIPPTHHVNAGVGVSRSRYFGSASVSYQDKAFWQDVIPYLGWTSPYTVLNLGAGIRSADGTMTAAVRVTNALNHTTQQHIFGDLMKRTVTGEVRFAF